MVPLSARRAVWGVVGVGGIELRSVVVTQWDSWWARWERWHGGELGSEIVRSLRGLAT